MRVTLKNQAGIFAAGLFLMTGAIFGQTNPPTQNGSYPNAATPTTTPGSTGQTTGGALGAGALDNSGNNTSGPGVSERAMDVRFAREAVIGGMTEVELGKLAVSKSSNDKVKQFGQRMVDDHSKASEELKTVAAKDHMTLPADMDSKHKAMVAKFSAMSGDEFDKAYVTAMVKDHEKDVANFQHESQGGTNEDLKSWATRTLPTLQEHTRMIKDIQKSMK